MQAVIVRFLRTAAETETVAAAKMLRMPVMPDRIFRDSTQMFVRSRAATGSRKTEQTEIKIIRKIRGNL